jgi:hypothetical protein
MDWIKDIVALLCIFGGGYALLLIGYGLGY